jgi:hypothetical protein
MRSGIASAVTLATAWLVGFPARPAPLAAQGTTEFAPFVGAYFPINEVFSRQDVLAAGDRMSFKHLTTVVLGGRLGGTVSDRMGFEVVLGYAPGKAEVEYTDPSNVTTRSDTSGGVILGSARALLRFGPAAGPVSLHFMFGASLTSHVGDAYTSLTEGTTDIGGLVGISSRFKVGPSLAIRLDLDDHLYIGKFSDANGVLSEPKLQSDFVVSLGVAIPFGAKPATPDGDADGSERRR